MIQDFLDNICCFLNDSLGENCSFFTEYRGGYQDIPPKKVEGALYLKGASIEHKDSGVYTDNYDGEDRMVSPVELKFCIELIIKKKDGAHTLNTLFSDILEFLMFSEHSPIRPLKIVCKEIEFDSKSLSFKKEIDISVSANILKQKGETYNGD